MEFAFVDRVVMDGFSGEEHQVDISKRSSNLLIPIDRITRTSPKHPGKPTRPLHCTWDISSQQKQITRPRKAHQRQGPRFSNVEKMKLVPTLKETKAKAPEGSLHWTKTDVHNSTIVWTALQDIYGHDLVKFDELSIEDPKEADRVWQQTLQEQLQLEQERAAAAASKSRENNDKGASKSTGWTKKAQTVAIVAGMGCLAAGAGVGFIIGGLMGMGMGVMAGALIGAATYEALKYRAKRAAIRRRSNPQAPAFM